MREGACMNLKKIPGTFSICKVTDYSQGSPDAVYCFTGQTEEEKSLVCLTEHVPQNTTEREDGWKAFRIQGILDFSLIGILAKITSLLAENQIGIFAISTYHTDYILTRQEHYERALKILETAGYRVEA